MFKVTVTDTSTTDSLDCPVVVGEAKTFEDACIKGHAAMRNRVKDALNVAYRFESEQAEALEVEHYEAENVKSDFSLIAGRGTMTWQCDSLSFLVEVQNDGE